jgi:hypothetical protein
MSVETTAARLVAAIRCDQRFSSSPPEISDDYSDLLKAAASIPALMHVSRRRNVARAVPVLVMEIVEGK